MNRRAIRLQTPRGFIIAEPTKGDDWALSVPGDTKTRHVAGWEVRQEMRRIGLVEFGLTNGAIDRAFERPAPEPRELPPPSEAFSERLASLTDRQNEIYDYIRRRILTFGLAPTVREIGREFEIRSPNGVMCHLKAIEKKGLIVRSETLSRGIRLRDFNCPHCGCDLTKPTEAECSPQTPQPASAGPSESDASSTTLGN